MARYRSFLFPDAVLGEDALVLDARESHHVVRVLRARAGETIEVLSGDGRVFRGRILGANAKALEVSVDSVTVAEARRCRLRLVQSIPKGKTMDLVLRMATEIGASEIVPVVTEQGEVQMKGGRLESKQSKWELTMVEACKQCGLAYVPSLMPVSSLKDWLASESAKAERTLRIVASLEANTLPLRDALAALDAYDCIEVAVGPEGDFSSSEYQQLSDAGYQPVRLGANVLRSETAAAYLLSVVDQLAQ